MKKTFFKTVVLLRKIKPIVFLVCVFLGNMAFSCADEKDSINNGCAESYQSIKTLNDAIGSIGFDEINKQYNVNIYIEGTADGMYTLYPCALADEFKTVNQKVKIDGNLFANEKLPKPQLGGQETFFVDIIKISKVNCAESYQTIKTLNDAIGSIGFDEINKQYTVNIYIEGTIDGMYTLYPCELADEFKTINQKVKIDGNLFTNDKLPKPQLGGQETFFVDIIKISKVNN